MGVALLAVVCAVSLQILRVYLPIVFDGFEDAGYVPGAIVVAGIPALGAILGSALRDMIGDRRSVLLGVGLLGVGRIALQGAGAIPFWLAAVTAAVAMWSLTSVVATGLAGRAPRPTQGFLLGFAADVAIRSVFRGWDPVWQEGMLPWVVALSLPLAMVASAIVASRSPQPGRSGVPWVFMAAIGPFVFLHSLFLQNTSFVATLSGITGMQAVAVILAIDAAAIVVVGAWPRWAWWLRSPLRSCPASGR